jgi:hypothetical protein
VSACFAPFDLSDFRRSIRQGYSTASGLHHLTLWLARLPLHIVSIIICPAALRALLRC